MEISRTFRPHFRLSIAIGVALLPALSACSSTQENPEYTMPDSLCGTKVNEKLFSSFMPPGEKLTTKESSPTPNSTKCAISVDGKIVAQTSQEWWDNMGVLEFARGMTLDDPANQSKDGMYAYSDDQAFGKTKECTASEHKNQVLYTAIQFPGSEHRDADGMKKLITDYTDSVQASSACRRTAR